MKIIFMINIKNIYKFIVSFESILISSMIPINIPIPSIEKIYRIIEIPINYQIPTIIFLTLIFSGEFLAINCNNNVQGSLVTMKSKTESN